MYRIISFSLYGSDPVYCQGAIRNAELSHTMYPGWRCRFYVDGTVSASCLEALGERGAEIVRVDKNLGPMYGRYWRLWVAADPAVDWFIVRDADSRLNTREKAAVEAWLASGKSFHIMRDAVPHRRRMLAGMWGGKGGILTDIAELIDRWGQFDQQGQNDRFMSEIIFPRIQDDYLCHDSVGYYDDAKPFPPHAPLDGTSFVGERVDVGGPRIDVWRRVGELEDQLRLVKIVRTSLDHGYASSSEFDRAARALLPAIAHIQEDARRQRNAAAERLTEIRRLTAIGEERQAAIERLTALCNKRETATAIPGGVNEWRPPAVGPAPRLVEAQSAGLDLPAGETRGGAAPAARPAFLWLLSRATPAQIKRLLRPNLNRFQQYPPRPLMAGAAYRSRTVVSDLPTMAIVTPTMNQVKFLAKTIASVLDQGYPRLNYTVQDGGSVDGTTAMLQGYGKKLDWQSAPDIGQADAINRGFLRLDGEIMAWLNSDDLYLPGTLAFIADYFRANPAVDMVYGNRVFIDAAGFEVGRCLLPAHDPEALRFIDFVPQETLFWRRRVWDAIGPIDTSFIYALDWDFVLRAEQAGFKIRHVPRYLGCFRVHAAQKTTAIWAAGDTEMRRLRQRSCGRPVTPSEVSDGVRGYLLRHVVVDRLHRLGWAGRRFHRKRI